MDIPTQHEMFTPVETCKRCVYMMTVQGWTRAQIAPFHSANIEYQWMLAHEKRDAS